MNKKNKDTAMMYLFVRFVMCACAVENLSAACLAENSNLAPKFKNSCKKVDSGYELCAFQSVTGSILRVDCQLRNRPWGTNVTIGFDMRGYSPQAPGMPVIKRCLFKDTYLGDYICSLFVDAAYAHTITLDCVASYTNYQTIFEQKQNVSVFYKTDFANHTDSYNTTVEVRRKDPLLNCEGRTGYMALGWSLNVNHVIVKGTLQNITLYVPGDKLEAQCAVGCHTKVPASENWTLQWTLDDVNIKHGVVSESKLYVLSLSRNLTEEDNGKTLECVFLSRGTISGKYVTSTKKSTKLLIVHQQDEYKVLPLDQPESSSGTPGVPEDLRLITTAATVGSLVALVLMVAAVFFCRRRFRSSVNEKNSDVAEKDTLEMYTELSPRGVVYADLNLQPGAPFAGPSETCQYAEIIGVVKNETSENLNKERIKHT